MILQSPILSGSIKISGSLTINGAALKVDYKDIVNLPSIVSSSNQVDLGLAYNTASYSNNSTTASYSFNSTTASYSNNSTTASYSFNSTTASYSNNTLNVHNEYAPSGSIKFWHGPQVEYDLISSSADPNTIYFVV